MKAILVTHSWFVGSEGFEVEEIEVASKDAAEDAALIRTAKYNRTFTHARCKALMIGNDEHLAPRRLTWGERFSGVLGYPSVLEEDQGHD